MENKQFRIHKNCNVPGVYIILNLDNGKVYIGSARNMQKRLSEHEVNIRHNRHIVKELQDDYNNGNFFIAYPITAVGTYPSNYLLDENLRHYEYQAIKTFKSTDPEKGYNKRLDKDKEIYEIRNIRWAKKFLDSYNYYKTKEYNDRDIKKFIEMRLNAEI